MKKAKKFQPLQLLNQKLRGLEVFESNNDTSHSSLVAGSATPTRDGRGVSPAPAPTVSTLASPDPDDIITRSHWQRPTGQDACSDPMCGKRLGAANGQINCRHCGKLFCEEHTMYQMKLSRAANHEPVRGLWYRVCETCYKSRDGYNDRAGFERSHFEYFKTARRKMIDKQYLETSRLETRLTRLTQLLADPPPPDPKQRSIWSSLSGDRDHIRALEQSIVPWQDDTTVNECPFCQQPFSQYALRRHHCRICGRVVCGDPVTACSAEIPLNVGKGRSSSTLRTTFQLAVVHSLIFFFFFQKNHLISLPLMCVCARTVNEPYSAKQTSLENLQLKHQINEPIKISFNLRMAFDYYCPNFSERY